jgi:lysophospholipid acyltransferase
MAGPPSDFATYNALVENTLFTSPPATNASSALAASESKAAAKIHRPSRVPALRKTVAYQKLALGLMFLAIYALYGGKASYDRVLDGKWWYSHSKLWRFGFTQLAGFMARAKYYAVWTVAEVSFLLHDLCSCLPLSIHRAPVFSLVSDSTDMTPRPERHCGTGCQTCSSGISKPLRVTRCCSTVGTAGPMYVSCPTCWPISSFYFRKLQVWLRDTIYKRVTPPGKKPGFSSTLITFLTSAFWVRLYCPISQNFELNIHHLYSTELPQVTTVSSDSARQSRSASPTDTCLLFRKLVAFVTAGFCTSLGRPFRHLIRPFFLPNPPQKSSALKTLYDFLGWFFVQSTLNYLVVPFFLLDLKSALTGWHRMGWYGHILIFGAYGALQLGGRAWLVRLNKKMGRAPPKKAIPGEARKKEF